MRSCWKEGSGAGALGQMEEVSPWQGKLRAGRPLDPAVLMGTPGSKESQVGTGRQWAGPTLNKANEKKPGFHWFDKPGLLYHPNPLGSV